ncbi:MAG: hypothetical protein M3Z02_00430 [Actinomycetota bacterium]|nr:hypothetical protein [Actinomycetota bacterium]
MSEKPASPLGRYDRSAGDDELHEVRLLNLPVRLLAAGREHHDELVHEFSLLAIADEEQRGSVPTRLLELVEALGARYAAAERPDELVDEALSRGEQVIDLTYRVPAHVVDAVDTLDRLMAEADAFCREERLLTPPRPPLIEQFSSWYLDEFRRQVAGAPPRAWDGPLDLR